MEFRNFPYLSNATVLVYAQQELPLYRGPELIEGMSPRRVFASIETGRANHAAGGPQWPKNCRLIIDYCIFAIYLSKTDPVPRRVPGQVPPYYAQCCVFGAKFGVL